MNNNEKKLKIVPRGREHPHLRALDALQCSYPGWKDDRAAVEQSFFRADSRGVETKMEGMKRKQRVHQNDRSHPELVQLDSLNCTYPGWIKDKAKGVKYHFEFPVLLPNLIETMRRKQQLHVGDRSGAELENLDQLKCTYPGWQNDKDAAERTYVDYPILLPRKIEMMRRKQTLHEGDKSHPDWVQLDAIQCTYPGWRKDKADAQQCFTDDPASLPRKMEIMAKKERVYKGDRSHSDLVELDSLKCNYPGWMEDKNRGEEYHYQWPHSLPPLIEKMRRKQKLHQGIRSAPELKQLDALSFTYPGWQNDKAKAERAYVDYPILLPQNIELMRRKQKAHEGSAACPIAVSGEDNSNSLETRRPAKKRRPNVESRAPREDTSSKCVVCLTAEKTHIFQPCGHHCVCATCSAWALEQQKCPFCRQTLTSSDPATAANQKALDVMVDLTK